MYVCVCVCVCVKAKCYLWYMCILTIIEFWNLYKVVFKYAWVCAESLQSCPALYDRMDCSPPGSSVRGILQARTLEGVASPSSRGSSWPRDLPEATSLLSPALAGRFSTASATKGHIYSLDIISVLRNRILVVTENLISWNWTHMKVTTASKLTFMLD